MHLAIKEKYPNVKIIQPRIKNNDMQLSDYNDLYMKYGKDIVAKQIKEMKLEEQGKKQEYINKALERHKKSDKINHH